MDETDPLTCHVNVDLTCIQSPGLLVSFQAKMDLMKFKKKTLLTAKPQIVPVSTSFLCIYCFYFCLLLIKHFIYPVEGLDSPVFIPRQPLLKPLPYNLPPFPLSALKSPPPLPVRVLSMGCGSRGGAVK